MLLSPTSVCSSSLSISLLSLPSFVFAFSSRLKRMSCFVFCVVGALQQEAARLRKQLFVDSSPRMYLLSSPPTLLFSIQSIDATQRNAMQCDRTAGLMEEDRSSMSADMRYLRLLMSRSPDSMALSSDAVARFQKILCDIRSVRTETYVLSSLPALCC